MDGLASGSALVTPDHPLSPAVAAAGDYVAVASVMNYPASGSASVFDASRLDLPLLGSVPVGYAGYLADGLAGSPVDGGPIAQVAATGAAGGALFVLDPFGLPPGPGVVPGPLLRHLTVNGNALEVRTYPWTAPVDVTGQPLLVAGFDVCEPASGPAFLVYVVFQDGRLVRYRGPSPLGGTGMGAPLLAESPPGVVVHGPWSVDPFGDVWTCTTDHDPATLQVLPWPVDGAPASQTLTVALPGYAGASNTALVLRAGPDGILIRRTNDRVELFRRFTPSSAAVLAPAVPPVVFADCDVLSVSLAPSGTLPSNPPYWWSADASMPVMASLVQYVGELRRRCRCLDCTPGRRPGARPRVRSGR